MLQKYFRRFKIQLLLTVVITLMTVLAGVGVRAQVISNPDANTCEPFVPLGWIEHTVQAGETLSVLAQETHTTVAQLQFMNCIHVRSHIYVGQILYVPGSDFALYNGANFALQCHEAGYESQDCIRMMNMLGEEIGNTLHNRCRDEGLSEDTCQWLLARYAEEMGNGLLTRCRNNGFETEVCYQMMLSLGQDDAEIILAHCLGDEEANQSRCRWMMVNMYFYQNDVPDASSGEQNRSGNRNQGQTCTTDCDQTQDRNRDQDQDQTCTQDCDPIQDRDRDQDQDQTQDQDRDRDQDQTCTQDCDPIQDRDRDGNGVPSGSGQGH